MYTFLFASFVFPVPDAVIEALVLKVQLFSFTFSSIVWYSANGSIRIICSSDRRVLGSFSNAKSGPTRTGGRDLFFLELIGATYWHVFSGLVCGPGRSVVQCNYPSSFLWLFCKAGVRDPSWFCCELWSRFWDISWFDHVQLVLRDCTS